MNYKDNQAIDIAKLFFSICVVTIHCYIVKTISNSFLQNAISSLIYIAVPFFFVSGSYFIIKKCNLTPSADRKLSGLMGGQIVKNYVKRLLRIYLFWSIVSFPFTISLWEADSWILLRSFLYSLFFKGYSVFWYIWSVIIVTPIYVLLSRYVKVPWFYFGLSFVWIAILRIFTHYGYQSSLPLYLEWTRVLYGMRDYLGIENILQGLTYISIGTGMVFYEKRNNFFLLFCIMIGLLLSFLDDQKAVTMGQPFLVMGIFPFIRDFNISIDKISSKSIRSISSIIYFIHINVIYVFNRMVNWEINFVTYIFIIFTVLTLSCILHKIASLKHMFWLKKLI